MHRGATVGGGDGLAALEAAKAALQATPRRWAITGVAGFIGSHLLEDLLLLDQEVVGLDDLSTGRPANLAEVRQRVGEARWARFRFEVGDIRDRAACARLCAGAAGVFHEAAVVSVPRSIEDPLLTFEVNVGGFLNVLQAALDAGVPRVVYASSSAVYGDSQRQPNREGEEGRPLSPYGLSKRMDEEAAALFHGLYGLSAIGLRYFNIFGPGRIPPGPTRRSSPSGSRRCWRNRPARCLGMGRPPGTSAS